MDDHVERYIESLIDDEGC